MAKEIRVPKLGQTMVEATVIVLPTGIGGEIKKGDIAFEIETDKATVAIESPIEGFVKHIFVKNRQVIKVGSPVMILGGKNEKIEKTLIDSLKKEIIIIENTNEQQTINDVCDNAKIIPMDKIKLGDTVKQNRLQRITAEKMMQSKLEKPSFYLTVKADVTDIVELREKLNKKNKAKLSYNDFIIKATATGVKKFPIMSAHLEKEEIRFAKSINVGLAVSIDDGLIVPTVKNADEKTITEISDETNSLIKKAQQNKLQLTDLEDACITISNLGSFGVDRFIPIVIPGQCSIIGVGKITDTCIPNGNDIAIRKIMTLSLSVDHKIANGAEATQFLDFVRKQLEDTDNFV